NNEMVSLRLSLPRGDDEVAVGLDAGDYFIVAHPFLKGRLTKANRPLGDVNNRSNLDVAVHFTVPFGSGKKPARAAYRFYPHNEFFQYTWKVEGNYEIHCSVRLKYEGASPDPAYDERRDSVVKLESKQALELALMIVGEQNKPAEERVWSSSVEDLLTRYRK